MTGHEKGVPILEMRRDKRVDPEHRMRLDAAIHRQGRGWFIDLDQSRLRIPATAWREANLARLQRSLRKEKGKRPVFHWGDSEWVHLIHGYHSI